MSERSNLVPDGEYTGKVVSGKLITASKRGTPGYECIVEVTEKPYDGKKMVWHGWMSPDASVRSMEALIAAGCTFPGDDTTNLEGLTSNEVTLVVETEEYTPEPSETNPTPTMTKRNRCAWINRGLGGRAGVAMDDAGKAAFKDAGKAALAAARAGRNAGGGGDAGIPKDAKGKAKF